MFALHSPFPDLNNIGLCCNPSALNSPDLKLVALSTFHLLTCHAELYSWTLSIIFETNLKSKVLCIFHMNDAVGRMLKAWDTPEFLSGKFYGQRSLVGYSPWGRKRQTQLSN